MEFQKKYWLPILVYDSECTMCLRFKQGIDRLEGNEKINKISIHDQEIYQAFPDLDPEKCKIAIHFIDQDRNIYMAGEAVTKLAHYLPGVAKFAWLAETGVGKKAVDYFYDMARKYRESLLNRCPKCKNHHQDLES